MLTCNWKMIKDYVCFIDTQVVTHIFRITCLGDLASRTPDYFAEEAPPSTSCRATRDVLLHHYGMAELALGETLFLVHLGGDDRKSPRL